MPEGTIGAVLTKRFLSEILGQTDTEISKPAKVYLGLLTVLPPKKRITVTSELTEPSATGYAKVDITAALAAAAEGAESAESLVENSAAAITAFTSTGSGESTVVGIYISDSVTAKAGAFIAWAELTASVKIGELYTPAKVEKGKLKVGLK